MSERSGGGDLTYRYSVYRVYKLSCEFPPHSVCAILGCVYTVWLPTDESSHNAERCARRTRSAQPPPTAPTAHPVAHRWRCLSRTTPSNRPHTLTAPPHRTSRQSSY